MKAKQFLNKLTENWAAKLICFVLALFLYLFHQLTIVGKKNIDIPLKVSSEGSVVRINDVPSAVRVTVIGNEQDILSIQRNMITATLNLDYLTESGSFDVPVTLKVSDELISMDPLEIKVKPETINVKTEKKVSSPVKIEPVFAGEPADGFLVSGYEMNNYFADISGAQSIINSKPVVRTETIDISGLKEDKTFDVSLFSVNKKVDILDNSQRFITVKIEPVILEKTFENISVNYASLDEKLLLLTKIPTVNIKVSGQQNDINKLGNNSFSVFVDFSGIDKAGEYDLPLTFIFPSSIAVVEKSSEFIHVEFIEKNVENSEAALDTTEALI